MNGMNETTLTLIAYFIIGMMLGVFLCSLFGEGIYENTLDNVCKELTGNPTAYFVKSYGLQSEFPCRVENSIFIFGKELTEQ